MKSPLHITLLALLLTMGFPATPWAETPAPVDPFVKDKSAAPPKPDPKAEATPTNYVFIFERYVVNKNDPSGFRFPHEKDYYTQINELVKQGKARLEDVSAVSARSDHHFTIHSMYELRYPTEFDPPGDRGFAYPTSFETRDVGSKVMAEFRPQAIGGDITGGELFGTFERTHFNGMVEYGGGVLQPHFFSSKSPLDTSVEYHEPAFIGTLPMHSGGLELKEGNDLMVRFLHVKNQPLPHSKETGKASRSRVMRFDYTFFSMERSLARNLLIKGADGKALHEEVTALLADHKAILESSMTLKTKSGRRTSGQAVTEFRYEIEMESTDPHYAQQTTNPPPPKGDSTPDAKATAPPKASKLITVFETRNIGHTIELEPILSEDGATVEIQHAPQFIEVIAQPKPEGIAANYPKQPLFQVRNIAAHMCCAIGQQSFIGTFNKPGDVGIPGGKDDGRVWMGFVKVSLE